MLLRALAVVGLMALGGCVSAEFSRHYDVGAAAADAGDFKTGIRELEAALAVDPDVSALAWHKLAYCYASTGRDKDAWIAMRKAVNLNSFSSERKQGFYSAWNRMKPSVPVGSSMETVRARLGEPDVAAEGPGTTLWTYGLLTLEFKDGRLQSAK